MAGETWRLGFIAAALGLILGGCPPPGGTDRGGGPSSLPVAEGAERAVVVFPAYVYARPGSGRHFGTLSEDVVVRLGQRSGEWQRVSVVGELAPAGWVLAERLGCRALREVELRPVDGADEAAVTLRPGARLAVLERAGETLSVETRHAVVRRGQIPASACGAGEAFVPSLPRDGPLFVTARETRLISSSGAGEPVAVLAEGERFVGLGPAEGGYLPGRSDGPVVVRGRVDASALLEDPRSTPLDRLGEPLGYTHETVVDQPLLDSPTGRELFLAPGGTPLNVLESGGDWARIATFGPVRLEGWVPERSIRRVALDHNELDPGARRREHAPVDRARPRAPRDDAP